MSINRVEISGNIGHAPELRSTASGTSVCSFSVCVNTRQKMGDEWRDKPNWVNVTFFGNRAEAIAGNLAKGSLVFVAGRLNENVWEKDGQTRRKLEVIGEDIHFGGSGQKQEQQDYEQPDLYDEDIPF